MVWRSAGSINSHMLRDRPSSSYLAARNGRYGWVKDICLLAPSIIH